MDVLVAFTKGLKHGFVTASVFFTVASIGGALFDRRSLNRKDGHDDPRQGIPTTSLKDKG